MKYISLVIMLALLIWTWSLTTAQSAFSLEQHRQVQAGIESDVRALIQSKYPTTSEIFCQQLYTETVKEGEELMAHFRCRAVGAVGDSEKVEQVFEGHVLLKSKDGFQSWQASDGKINASSMQFLNGIKVSHDDPMPPETVPEAKSNAEPTSAPAVPHSTEHGDTHQ